MHWGSKWLGSRSAQFTSSQVVRNRPLLFQQATLNSRDALSWQPKPVACSHASFIIFISLFLHVRVFLYASPLRSSSSLAWRLVTSPTHFIWEVIHSIHLQVERVERSGDSRDRLPDHPPLVIRPIILGILNCGHGFHASSPQMHTGRV